MRKLVNGQYYDMTPEEIEELNRQATESQAEGPLTEDDILEIMADHEYRICLIELGVDINDL